MAAGAFAFTKWYLDCLDRDGRLAILYWVTLEWRRIRLTWHSASVYAPGAPATAKSSVVTVAPPQRSAAGVSWHSQRIDCEAALRCGDAGVAPQILADGVTWACVAPGARAEVRVGDTTIQGTGYAERIELRVPPWRLGISGLRWGRWISDDAARSMIWIEWNGNSTRGEPERSEGSTRPNRWLFVDGAAADATAIDDGRVSDGTTSLDLGSPTVLVDRGLGHMISRVPALRAVAPKWFLGGSEMRSTRAGVLREGRTEVHGTAVDEVVEFG